MKKILLVHPPKTAGISLRKFFKDNNIEHEYYLHRKISELNNFNLNDYNIVVSVRNPFDRVISFYEYFVKDDSHKRFILKEKMKDSFSFERYIDELEKFHTLIEPCFNFISLNDISRADYIIKFERLNNDIINFVNEMNLNITHDLEHRNINKIKSEIILNDIHKEKIIKVFEKDFINFNYDSNLSFNKSYL